MTPAEARALYLAEYDRLVLVHLADDRQFLERLAACKSGDVIETLLAERLRRLRVELYRFGLDLRARYDRPS